MCVCICACVLCMTLFHILMLTVGRDNTPKRMCMLCMTLFCVLILTVGHDSLMCVCVCSLIPSLPDLFQHTRVTLKTWEWPGDEVVCVCV